MSIPVRARSTRKTLTLSNLQAEVGIEPVSGRSQTTPNPFGSGSFSNCCTGKHLNRTEPLNQANNAQQSPTIPSGFQHAWCPFWCPSSSGIRTLSWSDFQRRFNYGEAVAVLLDGGVHTRCRPVGQDWANGGQQNEQQFEAPPLTEEPALVSAHARSVLRRAGYRQPPVHSPVSADVSRP